MNAGQQLMMNHDVDGKCKLLPIIIMVFLYSYIVLICFILQTTQKLKIAHSLHVKETVKTLGMGNVVPSQDPCT